MSYYFELSLLPAGLGTNQSPVVRIDRAGYARYQLPRHVHIQGGVSRHNVIFRWCLLTGLVNIF